MNRCAAIVRVVVPAVAAGTLVAACSSGTRSTTTTSPSTSTPSPTSAPAAGGATGPTLKGLPVVSFTCPRPGDSAVFPSQPFATVIASAVTALLVCAPAAPVGGHASVTVGPTSPHFRPLLSALSAPDAPRSTGMCPLYADLAEPVLARTPAQVLLVHVPLDGCQHDQAAAGAAIRSALGG